ncbi:F0F1 ATP synthase subunit B' [Pseudooceanicola sp. C21-150M6]|uniref:F0F1 ATP synthase subunit B' n=1 Tax=Pseudooceanicola sp. C21-150M6 TaxID=3434355 RepID=UPI003D800198
MATEHSDGLADATGVAEHAASTPGMPQLNFDHWGNQIFWLIVTLVVIYFILSRVALPRISAVLAERAGAITNDIAAAEDLKQKAKDAEAAYEKALADARAEANEIVAKTRADIQADLNAAIAKADAEISARQAEGEKAIAEIRANALVSVEAVAKDTAQAVVASLGFSADSAAIDKAVTDRMKG